MSIESLGIDPSEKRDKKIYARDAWFKGYTDGNLLMPQVFSGIRLFVAESLLRDRPEDLRDFRSSVLSPKQLEVLGKISSGAHGKGNIDVSISENRMQELWSSSKKQAEFGLSQSLAGAKSFSVEDLKSLEGENLRALLSEITQIFKSDHEVKERVKAYTAFLSSHSHARPGSAESVHYLDRIFNQVRESLNAANAGRNFNITEQQAINYFLPGTQVL